MVTLGWSPEGTCRRAVGLGRPRKTWRRTVEEERQQAGLNDWDTVRAVARDRAQCKQNVAALCAY